MALGELRKLLERHARAGLTTSIEGVRVCRFEPGAPPASSMSGTSLALIAQGSKRLVLGNQVYDYGPGQYLVTSVDLPVAGQAVGTGTTLGFGMTLDGGEIADLVANAQPGELPQASGSGQMITVSDAPDELLDAVVRLLRLLDRPTDRRVLAPMIRREIVWRLLTGHNGDAVRQIGLAGSGHVARAVRWIRENYAKPFKVEEVAQVAGLSVSAFYRNFNEATSMSPIQFQKQIRLQEARLLLASRPNDVSTVGHRVGYGSVSQFSREYRRQFGTPPSLDTVRTGDPEPAEAAALP
jgi:AraC-like DNA-binding protein